jgi:hypothetical protein
MRADSALAAARPLRLAVGGFLVLHGLAHSLAGVTATNAAALRTFESPDASSAVSLWMAAVLWSVASGGFVASGLALMGTPMLRGLWRRLALVAAAASLLLIVEYVSYGVTLGVVLDLAVLAGMWRSRGHGQTRREPHSGRILHHYPQVVR